MFQNANYFLNFQKLLGIAKGVKVDVETSQVRDYECVLTCFMPFCRELLFDCSGVELIVDSLTHASFHITRRGRFWRCTRREEHTTGKTYHGTCVKPSLRWSSSSARV
jgi:hypothetical protein